MRFYLTITLLTTSLLTKENSRSKIIRFQLQRVSLQILEQIFFCLPIKYRRIMITKLKSF